MVETVTRSESTAPSQASNAELEKKGRLSLKLISSTSIITLSLFFLINFAIEKIDPLERLFWTGLTGARQHIFVSKLPKLLSSSSNPDVLLLGSSVSLFPAVRADDQLAGTKTRWDFWYERNVILPYDKALYLEHLLSGWAGHKVSVANASVGGSVVSDQDLILKKYLASGKEAKVLIVCLAPRDFLDNSRTDIESTPTYNVLNDWTSLPELVKKGASWQSMTNILLGQMSNYYLHRQEYSHFFTHLAARQLDRPVTLFEATNQKNGEAETKADQKPVRNGFFNPSNVPVYEQPPNTLGHLDEYKSLYLPINRQQFLTQTQKFKSLLLTAREHHIPVIVVNTPMPVENTNIIPEKFRAKYRSVLMETCKQTGAALVEPAELQPYDTAKDFEDASHISTRGSIKYWDAISEEMKRNPQAVSALTRKAI